MPFSMLLSCLSLFLALFPNESRYIFCLAVWKCRFYCDSGILRSIDQEMIAFEETGCHLSSQESGTCQGLVRVLSRRMFDHISGHRGPAKVTDKGNHHTMSHRATEDRTRVSWEAAGVWRIYRQEHLLCFWEMEPEGRVSRLRVG